MALLTMSQQSVRYCGSKLGLAPQPKARLNHDGMDFALYTFGEERGLAPIVIAARLRPRLEPRTRCCVSA